MTGLSWVDVLPAGWKHSRVARHARIYAGGTPDRSKLEYWEGGTIPWLNSGAVNQFDVGTPSSMITEEAIANSSARWVPKGAVVVALAGQGKTKGMAAQVHLDATCNQSLSAVVPHAQLHSRYLLWWLTANYWNIRSMGGGDLRDGLNLEHIGAIPLPLPPAEEQRQIAAFLDRETGQIDELIAKQERLLTTLAERRRAKRELEIRRASTSFSSDDEPETRPLGSLAHEIVDCLHTSAKGVEGGEYLVVRTSCVRDGQFDQAPGIWVDERTHLERVAKAVPEVGDVLLTREAPAGEACLVPKGLDLSLGQRMVLVRPSQKLHPQLVVWNMYSSTVRRYLDVETSGQGVQNLTMARIRHLPMTVPPRERQDALVEALQKADSEAVLLSEKVTQMVVLLRERRQALISAAVTGKIDIRSA